MARLHALGSGEDVAAHGDGRDDNRREAMSPNSRRARAVRLAACLSALVLTAAACGDGESSTNPSASGSSSATATSAIDALYAGTFKAPEATGPVAQKGKKVLVVNTGTQAPTGGEQAAAVAEVAKILGWNAEVFDGKFEPATYQEGIRQAIAQKVDAIWLFAIDCPLVSAALQEAKAAGIPVFGQEAADCIDVDKSGAKLFNDNLQYVEGDFLAWGRGLGAAQADWIVAQVGQNANVIEFAVPSLIITQALSEGFNTQMATCTTCKVTKVDIALTDFGPQLQSKFETALLRNPQANALAVSFDDLMTLGGASAVMGSGRNSELQVIAGTGFDANNELIRTDAGQDAGYGYDISYETWAAADMINRYFAGDKQAPSGVGLQVYDRDNGLPPAGENFSTSVDYQSVYEKTWGATS
jgi:ribose transport system substrate-binding protein